MEKHPIQKMCIHFVYKNCTRYKIYTIDVYKMYTKCIPHFDKLLYTFCIQNHKNYASSSKILSKGGIHLVYIHFVYILYTKICRNVGHILYGNIWYTFCIQNLYKSLSKCGIQFVYSHFVYILYTSVLIYKKCKSLILCIQFVYKIHTECIYK